MFPLSMFDGFGYLITEIIDATSGRLLLLESKVKQNKTVEDMLEPKGLWAIH